MAQHPTKPEYTTEVHEAHHTDDVIEVGVHQVHSSKREIWKVFFILLALTVLEFAIALTPAIRDNLGKGLIVFIFLFLTVLKAFYIVAFFMHLKHEKINLAYSILIPLIFILYLIALLLFEGKASVL